MKLAVRILLIAVLFVFLPVRCRAQASSELIEEVKRLAGEVADLREANAAHNRRVAQLQKEIESLRESVRESHDRATSKMGDFATREDLKKIIDNIKDVDQKRESDRKLILGEFDKLSRTLSQPVERPERPTSRKQRDREKEKEKEPEKEAAPVEGTFLPYKVKDGQRLADIIKEYNGALKEQGRPSITLEQVKRANPKMNINRILVGQEILLPVPDKKK